ncbi:MAG: hypothetical protein HYR85_08345 [Planctomycetes bacterium]|nr:hypothetical protein [Planctomycetota bacterium]MBI3845302.1 hypothetical protein [Planctomycetota bacterium]
MASVCTALAVAGAATVVLALGMNQRANVEFHFVRGTVVVPIHAQPQQETRTPEVAKTIALPHASVYLVRPKDPSRPIASALSDLSGRFIIKTDETGAFSLCVEAEGFDRHCEEKEFRFAGPALWYGDLILPLPLRSKSEAAAFGSITLSDGKVARGFEPFMDVNAYPIIDLTTGSRSKHRAYVNNFGEYVIPRVPVKEDFALRVSIDSHSIERRIRAQTKLIPGGIYPIDIVFPAAAPRIRLVSAMANGKPIQIATPGSTLTLHAVADDRDGFPLQYRWLLPDGSLVGPTTNPDLKWTVPSQRGNLAFSVLVSNQHGGYTQDGITLTAAAAAAPFSGTVVDTFDEPIGGALVDVNGRLTNANARGQFSFSVPLAERYVMNIRSSGLESPNQRGFGTGSYIYKAPITGGRWVLRRAQVTTVDPTQPIVVQHQRGERDCVGLTSKRMDWKTFNMPEIFQFQDGRGNVVPLGDVGARDPAGVQRAMRLVSRINPALAQTLGETTRVKGEIESGRVPCTPGIKIEIPANALVDPSTNRPPNGPVQLALSTVDLTASDQMPGDYSADDGTGNIFGMESMGAGSIEIGAGVSKYQLKPGTSATVTIPVDVTQLEGGAVLEPKVPFLYYDERKGVWLQDGEATLSGSGSNVAYVKKVTHFSTMNADILKSGQSCVAVELDPAAGFTLPLDVEVILQPSVPNPNVIQVRHLLCDSTKSNVIYNLPNDSDIVLVPIIQGVLPDGSAGNVPAGVFVVNTGGPQSSAVTPPSPNADGTYYGESGGVPTGPCGTRVTLTKLSPVTIANGFEYLQGLYFESTNVDEFSGTIATAIDDGVKDYYDQADPRKLRDSFNLFKQKNRFGEPLGPGEIEVEAQYANSGDLGFGRDMHCRRNAAPGGTFDYACYVTNFGQPPANNPDQQDADDVLDPSKQPDATVAMEFSRVENALNDPIEFPDDDRAVKFYVYDTKNPDNPPLRKADLDGFGARPVPQLCMVCHGGNLSSVPADVNNPAGPKKGAFANRIDIISMHSNFIPFDMHFYKFPASKSGPSQEAAFKSFNKDIVRGVAAATGTGEAIVELIDDSLYPGNPATQVDNAVVTGWDPANVNSNQHRFYRDVFARACRTCHSSHPFGAPSFADASDFEAATALPSAQSRVCTQKVMPHAKRTNDIFWTSLGPNMPGLFELYGQTLPSWSTFGGAQCGQVFQGGGTAPSVFASQIYPILAGNCAGCHSVVGNANFRVGNIPDTYTSITTATTKDGSTKYIIGSDPGNSRIYQRITSSTLGPRMPLGGPNLASTDTDIPPDGVFDATEILAWINSGAPGP